MKNNLLQSYPKIGIRPVIDGRMREIRESLERQTMEMTRSALKLISRRLKYPAYQLLYRPCRLLETKQLKARSYFWEILK